MIIFPTIRHSGSHFAVHLFGFQIEKLKSWKSSDELSEAVFDHISPYFKHLFLPLIKDNLTVIPLRHPFLIEKSWDDRQKDKRDLYSALDVLINEIDPLEPFYLPLDVADRQDYLDALNKHTGLDLHTKWGAQGVKHNNQDRRFADVIPSQQMKDFYREHNVFFDRFYRVAI